MTKNNWIEQYFNEMYNYKEEWSEFKYLWYELQTQCEEEEKIEFISTAVVKAGTNVISLPSSSTISVRQSHGRKCFKHCDK